MTYKVNDLVRLNAEIHSIKPGCNHAIGDKGMIIEVHETSNVYSVKFVCNGNIVIRTLRDDQITPASQPILIWHFHEAPGEIRISQGGDEDLVIAVPPKQEAHWRVLQLCDDAAVLRVLMDGSVERQDCDDSSKWEAMPFNCPNYAGWTIIIPSHA